MFSQANDVQARDRQGSVAQSWPLVVPGADPTTSRGKANKQAMSQFLGTHQSRLDAKNRVSIPAGFRSVLRAQLAPAATPDTASLVLRPSHTHDCIEVWPATVFHALEASLNRYDPLSDSYADLAFALYGDAFPADADKEGRIVLSDDLKAHAHLTDSVAFVGLGRTFQIWQPDLARERRTQARELARTKGMSAPTAVVDPEARA
jgi:MraZ protein